MIRIFHIWTEYGVTASKENIFLDPIYYGYTLDDNEMLFANISSSELPDNFPQPYTSGKCAQDYSRPGKKSLTNVGLLALYLFIYLKHVTAYLMIY